MEIVLALMLLGASPIGAAMLDKPTRKRFVRFAQVHNPFRKEEEEVMLAMEPRNKDWTQDTILATMWTEAFKYYQISGRSRKLKWALQKRQSFLEQKEKIYPILLKTQMDVDEAESNGQYVSYKVKELVKEAWEVFRRSEKTYENGLDKDEKFLVSLVEKYGVELEYNQDLIRLAASPELPHFDYSALALSVAK